MKLNIILGDITEMASDAIVNAANTSLLGGEVWMERSTVRRARSFKRMQGPERGVRRERRNLPGVTAFWQSISYIRRDRYGGGGNHREKELLESCYKSCLSLASEYGCRSIAFPSISTGIYGFPLAKAAEIAVRVILNTVRCIRDRNR